MRRSRALSSRRVRAPRTILCVWSVRNYTNQSVYNTGRTSSTSLANIVTHAMEDSTYAVYASETRRTSPKNRVGTPLSHHGRSKT